MKKKSPLLCLLSLSALLLLRCLPAAAEELELVNRPVNTSGLTGLLFTTSPYTIPAGTVEIGASVLSENSTRPNYTFTEFPVSITTGLNKDMELALRSSYINIKEGATTTTSSETVTRKTGNLKLSYKWNFLPQAEFSAIPGVALIITGIAPTQKKTDQLTNSVAHWGMRIGLSAGTEITWKDHVFAIYADAQAAGQDLTENRLRDRYGIANAGFLFPISKYQNLQMFVEYSMVTGREIIALDGGDYTAFTYGLRLVGERFNFTIGSQFLHKSNVNYDNSGRVNGLLSMKF